MAENTGDPEVKEEKPEEQPQELTDKERLAQSVEKFSTINNESFQSELLSLAETIKNKFKLEHDKTTLEAFMAGTKSVVIKVLGTKAGHLEIPKAVADSKIGKWLGLASKDITYGDLTTALVGAVIAGASSAGVKTAFYSLTGVGGVAAAAVAGGVIGGTRSALTEGHMYAKEARSAENWRKQIEQMNDPASKLRAIELLIKDEEFKKHLKANADEMIDLVTMYGDVAAEAEEAGLLESAMKLKGIGHSMDGVDRYITRVDQETRKRMFKAFGQGAVRGMIFSTIGYGAAKGLEWVFDKVGTAFMSGAHAQGASEVPGAQGHVWHTGTGEHVGEGHLNIDEQGRLNGYSIVTVDDKGLVNGDIAGATAHDVAKQVSNALVQDKLMDAAHQVTFQDKLAALITKDHAGGQFAGGETIRISANDLNQALGEAGTSINKSTLEALQPIGAAAAAGTGAEAIRPGAIAGPHTIAVPDQTTPAGSPVPHLAATESGTTPAAPLVAPTTPGAPVGPHTIAVPDQTAPVGTTAPHLSAAEPTTPAAPHVGSTTPVAPIAPNAPVVPVTTGWFEHSKQAFEQGGRQALEGSKHILERTGNILEQNQRGIGIGAGVVAAGALATIGIIKFKERKARAEAQSEEAAKQERLQTLLYTQDYEKLLAEPYLETDPRQIISDLELLASKDNAGNDEAGTQARGDKFKEMVGALRDVLPDKLIPTPSMQEWTNEHGLTDTEWRIDLNNIHDENGELVITCVGNKGGSFPYYPDSEFFDDFEVPTSTVAEDERPTLTTLEEPSSLGNLVDQIKSGLVSNHQTAVVEINRLSDRLYDGLRIGLTIDGQPGTLVGIERVNLKLKATEPLKTFEFVVETGGNTRRLAVEEFFAQTSGWNGGGEISAPATDGPEAPTGKEAEEPTTVTETETTEYKPADNNADTIRQDLLARGEGKRQDIIDYLAKKLVAGQTVIVTDAASGLPFWTLTEVVDDGNAMISFRDREPRQENLGMVASPTSIWEFSQPEPEIEPIVTNERRATEAQTGIVGSLNTEIARRKALETAEGEATIETGPTLEVLDQIEAMTAQNDLAEARTLLASTGLASQPLIFPEGEHKSMASFFEREGMKFDLRKPFNLEVNDEGKFQFKQDKNIRRFTLPKKSVATLLQMNNVTVAAAPITKEPTAAPEPAAEAPVKAVEYNADQKSAEELVLDLRKAFDSGNQELLDKIVPKINIGRQEGRFIDFTITGGTPQLIGQTGRLDYVQTSGTEGELKIVIYNTLANFKGGIGSDQVNAEWFYANTADWHFATDEPAITGDEPAGTAAEPVVEPAAVAEEPADGGTEQMPPVEELKPVPRAEVITQLQALQQAGNREQVAKFLESSGLMARKMLIPEKLWEGIRRQVKEANQIFDVTKPVSIELVDGSTEVKLVQEGASIPLSGTEQLLAAVLPETITPARLAGQAATEAKPAAAVAVPPKPPATAPNAEPTRPTEPQLPTLSQAEAERRILFPDYVSASLPGYGVLVKNREFVAIPKKGKYENHIMQFVRDTSDPLQMNVTIFTPGAGAATIKIAIDERTPYYLSGAQVYEMPNNESQLTTQEFNHERQELITKRQEKIKGFGFEMERDGPLTDEEINNLIKSGKQVISIQPSGVAEFEYLRPDGKTFIDNLDFLSAEQAINFLGIKQSPRTYTREDPDIKTNGAADLLAKAQTELGNDKLFVQTTQEETPAIVTARLEAEGNELLGDLRGGVNTETGKRYFATYKPERYIAGVILVFKKKEAEKVEAGPGEL